MLYETGIRLPEHEVFCSLVYAFDTFSIICKQCIACQCVTGKTLQDEYDDHDHILVAQVLNIEKGKNQQSDITVKIIEQWKGDYQEKFSFWSCRGVASGGFQLQIEKKYLIFAEKLTGSNYPVISDCDKTKPLSDVTNEVLFLDQKSNITRFYYDGQPSFSSSKLQIPIPIYMFGIFGIIPLVVFIGLFTRKRK